MTHRHCERGCEHPQPFRYYGTWFCGLCWFARRRISRAPLCDCE
jgi:hypothetical protein